MNAPQSSTVVPAPILPVPVPQLPAVLNCVGVRFGEAHPPFLLDSFRSLSRSESRRHLPPVQPLENYRACKRE